MGDIYLYVEVCNLFLWELFYARNQSAKFIVTGQYKLAMIAQSAGNAHPSEEPDRTCQ